MRHFSHTFHTFFPWFDRREPFLVVECFAGRLQATVLKANLEKRTIFVERTEGRTIAQFSLPNVAWEMKRLVASIPHPKASRVFVSVDPLFATTVQSTVSLIREKPAEPIDEADLDNLIGQGLWKLFDRYRARAAAKMHVGDIDVVLADVMVRRIRLDDHKVVNPVGFAAKTVEFQIVQTMSSREFLSVLKTVFVPGVRVRFMENGALYADWVARIEPGRDFLIANLFEDHTDIFAARGSSFAYADSFPWGAVNVRQTVAEACGVSATVAEELMARYFEGTVSPRFLERFERILLPEFQIMANGVVLHLDEVESRLVYLNPFFELPSFVFHERFERRLPRRGHFRAFGESALEPLGFTVTSHARAALPSRLSSVAAFLQFHFSPQGDTLVEASATRHTRWLGGAA